ncbi:tetratricopeptide (TPR) repeat protein [Angulomicrobium tetraedrale]|uniref:Tetratricopeptide (TPR) repeat protein n=1 Tax=Ancylobacter tetraedralis TaxID=217068 RepID=A0A839ZEG9_9HYPH|nr:tetratricopeptide (TPR) repeat protein [Ancylobacter tetraedralis]
MSDSASADLTEAGLVPPEGTSEDARADSARRALARVLESEELRSSPQLSNILRFIVEATLEGRREAIKGYTIAVEALGRDASFDPQADPIVRVEATRLRRALERYYAGAGAADEIEIAVPRGSYVPQFVPRRLGEPASEAPVPEATIPEAAGTIVLPERPVRRRLRLGRVTMIAALALLLLMVVASVTVEVMDPGGLRALVAGAMLKPLDRSNRLGIPMVEVRTFDSTGGTPLPPSEVTGAAHAVTAGDFAARAIEVRIRDALARFDLLDVLASPDARPALHCGAEGVSPDSAFALAGLVENHDDGSLSLLLRLSDLCDGTIVWSHEFDDIRRGGDTGIAEASLVRDIMAAIAEPYGIIQARARARVIAAGGPGKAGPYGCALMAYSYWRSYLPADHERAHRCLEQAVAADGSFALGYALLAELSLDEVRNGVSPQAATPALNRALAAAEQAVELAPTSAYARRALMDVRFFRGERGAAISAGETALSLNPYDIDVLADVGGRLIVLGELERGEAMLASAAQAVPGMPPSVDYHRVIAAYLRGDARAASTAADQLMGDGYAPGLLARALADQLAGETEAARADLRKLIETAPAWGSEPDMMIARFFPNPDVARRVRADLVQLGLPLPKSSASAN